MRYETFAMSDSQVEATEELSLLDNASPVVDSCDFSNSYYGTLMQYESSPTYTNNTIGSSDMVTHCNVI